MKQRVLVMNGQRLVQSEYDNQWVTTKVGKAGQIRPGIYNLDTALVASKDKGYDGVVLHADQAHVYQQVGKSCVRHSAHDLPKLPTIGATATIRYDGEAASLSQDAVKHVRGVRR